MATPLSADRMLAALTAEGVKVRERSGWRTHNRNSQGPWGGVNGVLIHHTAGSNSLALVSAGRPDLPGPLAHTHLAKDGTATMVGNGRANHAGRVALNAHNAVVNENKTHPQPLASSGSTDGNAHYYGIEIENLGNGRDPYPAVQYDQAVRWAAAICRAHGWGADSVVGHKETSIEGKIDPSFGMGEFRDDVAERLKRAASWSPGSTTPKPPQEDSDMPRTLGLYDAQDKTLVPGQWTTLPVEKKTDLMTGAKAYTASVMLTVAAAPLGGTLQGRFYHQRPDGSRWEGGIMERPTSAGNSFVDFSHAGSIAATEKLRFEAAYFPADATDRTSITVSTSRVRGLYWN